MKNLKKLLAVLVVVTLLATSMIPAFAAGSFSYTTQAQALYDLGLYKGSSTTTFEPDLGSALDRQQGVVMLIRLLGKESAALALSNAEVDATLIIFSDAKNLASWAKKHIAYAVLYKYVAGLPNGTFAPNNALSGKEFCTMLLRALGYTVDAAGYAGACYQLSNVGGITFAEAAKFNEKELVRDDMVGIAYGTLKADYKATGKSVIETMVENKVVTEAKAISAGVYNIKLEEDAKAAIAAYKAAPISNLTEIAAAEAKKAAADTAVSKIVVAATKTALEKEIADQAAKIAAAKKTFQDADAAEAAAIAAAEAATKAFETASIATTADVTAAEGLSKTATDKANLVKTAASKTAFLGRIAAQDKVVADRKADLVVIADATTAVNAYTAAAYDSLEKIAAAKALEATASEKVAKIVDTAKKAELNKKIADQKAIIAAMEAKLSTVTIADVNTSSLKQMVVTFDKALDVNTITTTTLKVAVNNADVTYTKSLSADGKVLTIIYDNAINQNDVVKLAIDGIKDSVGISSGKIEKVAIVKDVIDPAFKSFNVLSSKKIKLYFSEPVNMSTPENGDNTHQYRTTDVTNSGATLKVDGNLSFASYEPLPLENAVIVTFYTKLANGNHTITLTDVKDFVGFKTSDISFSVNVSADTTAPAVVAAKANSTTEIVLEFNEPVNVLPTSTFVVKETGSSVEKTVISRVSALDGKGVKLTLANGTPLTAASIIGFTVDVTGVSDDSGNISTKATANGQLADDTIAPTVLSFNITDANKLEVVFSEDVNYTNAVVKIYVAGKTVVSAEYSNTLGNLNFTNAASGKENAYDLNFDNVFTNQDVKSYDVTIEGITDKSVRSNPLVVSGKLTFAAKDMKSPTIASATLLGSSTDNNDKIEITFSESMSNAALSNLSNYIVNGNIVVSTIPGAKISSISADSKKVVLLVPDADNANTTTVTDIFNEPVTTVYTLAMSDLAGRPLSGNGSSLVGGILPYNVSNGYIPFTNVGYVQMTGTNSIKIGTQTGHLFGYVDANAFKFVDGNGVLRELGIVAAQIAADGTYVTLTTSVALTAYGSYNDNGTFRALNMYVDSNYAVKDTNGQQLSIALANAVAAADKIKANQTDLVKAGNTIEFVFDETIAYVTGIDNNIMAGAVEIKGLKADGTTITLIPGADYTVAVNGTKLVVTLSTAANLGINKLAGATISNVTSAKIVRADYLKDSAGNGVTVK